MNPYRPQLANNVYAEEYVGRVNVNKTESDSYYWIFRMWCIQSKEKIYRRVVHESDEPAGGVGWGRVTILPDFGGSGRVGTSDF